MKYLSEYTEEPLNKVFEEEKVFFAFGKEQFDKGKSKYPEVEEWGHMYGGMHCPKGNGQKVQDKMNKVYRECRILDIKENGVEGIIRRELENFECFYTYDISDAVERLAPYGITEKQVKAHFNLIRGEYNDY